MKIALFSTGLLQYLLLHVNPPMNVCMYTGSGGVYTGIGVVAKSVATLSLQSEIMAENGFSKRIITVEKTFAMIKPDAIDKADEILEIIEENGFTILQVDSVAYIRLKRMPYLQKRRVQLKPEQASEFYAEHFGKMFFPSLINYICRLDQEIYNLSRKPLALPLVVPY